MLNKYNDTFLIDKDFLRLLDLDREKEVFVKIIALDFNENSLEEIEGRVTQGSITVDGTSSVRRVCSLSLVANELHIHEFYWSLNTKFKLYVGIKNNVKHYFNNAKLYKNYPDICWFKMGTYVISSFNTSQTTNAYTINISGKDKMAFLNGEIGGTITPLSWDFGKIDKIDSTGLITTKDYLIKDIILEAVHEYSQEPYWNIIINDVDDYGLELLEYRGDQPLYLLYNIEQGVIDQIIFDLSDIPDLDIENIIFDPRIKQLIDDNATEVIIEKQKYTIIKAERGDVIGYRTTDLTYPGDLISNVGEPVTSMLDKIITMLGNFEYFYDLDGRFVFQKKRNYIQTSLSSLEKIEEDNSIMIKNASDISPCVYSFDNTSLITAFSNSPALAELKNDYSIWGTKKGISGIEIPIHLRYAIDSKPWMYTTYDGRIFITPEGKEKYSQLMQEYQMWINQQESSDDTSGKLIFKKEPVPSFLQNENGTSDWWDITNWARYYYLLTGQEPDLQIGDYGTEGFTGTLVFPNGETFSRRDRGQLVIDLERDTHNPFYGNNYVGSNTRKSGYFYLDRNTLQERESTASWSPMQHGFDGCYHTYKEFLFLDANNNCQSFIYKPQIPTSSLTNEIIAIMDTIEIEDLGLKDNTLTCDWRELIYQMSLDYNKYHHNVEFLTTIDDNNTLPNYTHLYPGGHTGYEQYYIDLNGFWRDLYDPFYKYSYKVIYVNASTYEHFRDDTTDNPYGPYYIYQDCSEISYNEMLAAVAAWQPICGEVLYYYNYKNQIVPTSSIPDESTYTANPGDYCILRGCKALGSGDQPYTKAIEYNFRETYYEQISDEYVRKPDDSTLDYDSTWYWATEVSENPEGLQFWFDFLDTDGQLGQYKVSKVGDRTKAVNDNNINSIYFRDVPTVIFVEPDSDIKTEKEKKGSGYTYIQLSSQYENLFSLSARKKCAMDILDEWLYSNAYCAESITITALPVYYLEPNTRIMVRDDNSGINGEYIITRLTFPLMYNGTMSITATKAVENLY